MDRFYGSQDDQEYDVYQQIQNLIEQHPGRWQTVCAVAGLAGGILSPLLGTLTTAAAWLAHSQRVSSYLNDLSIVLFTLTIPLLAFGAHCLDLLEKSHHLSSFGE